MADRSLPYQFLNDPAFIDTFQQDFRALHRDEPLYKFLMEWARYQGKRAEDTQGIAHAAALFYDTYFPDMRGDNSNPARNENLTTMRTYETAATKQPDTSALNLFPEKHLKALYDGLQFNTHKNITFKRIVAALPKPRAERTSDENTMIDMFTDAVFDLMKEAHILLTQVQKNMPAVAATTAVAGRTITINSTPPSQGR